MRCLRGFPDVVFEVVFGVYPLASVEFYQPVCGEDGVAAMVLRFFAELPGGFYQIRERIAFWRSADILRREAEPVEDFFYTVVNRQEVFVCSSVFGEAADGVVFPEICDIPQPSLQAVDVVENHGVGVVFLGEDLDVSETRNIPVSGNIITQGQSRSEVWFGSKARLFRGFRPSVVASYKRPVCFSDLGRGRRIGRVSSWYAFIARAGCSAKQRRSL